jgi:glycosyltransferase involved in cell wall biosynthesis
MPADMKVSVIIPAYNAEETLGEAIEAVLAQRDAGEIELVVVDDGSSDRTEDVVRRYPCVKYVRQVNAGPACARNRGARESGGQILLFTDADCRPQPGWVRKMTGDFARPDVSVVAGSYGIANPSSALARIIHAEIMFRHRVLMPRSPRFFGSYNFSVRREVFEAAGGFNAEYRRASGEDNDLSYKIIAAGGRIAFRADACVDHYHQESLADYLKEQFRHGFWRLKMYKDHPGMMAGDGYTFWKDALEVPLAAAHGLVFIWPLFGAGMAIAFLLFEIAFGCIIMGPVPAALSAGAVFWLRSFARTAGFMAGGSVFIKDKILSGKKSKKTLRVTSTMLI